MSAYERVAQSDVIQRLSPYLGMSLTAVITIGLALLFGTVVLVP